MAQLCGPSVVGCREGDRSRPLHDDLKLWYVIRRQAAGIEDVRLLDLRHTFGSHVVIRGTPLPLVAHLLGHSQMTMTLRYAHTGDHETESAAGRIGQVISGILETTHIG